MNPFQSLREYERFVYTLQPQYASIQNTALVVAHPNDPTLASTHPHHKHIPPDIKYHRLPAPGLTFTAPNLPFLTGEIEEQLEHG